MTTTMHGPGLPSETRWRVERLGRGGGQPVVDEILDLAGSDDFVGTLLRSAQLAAEVGRSSESWVLVDVLV